MRKVNRDLRNGMLYQTFYAVTIFIICCLLPNFQYCPKFTAVSSVLNVPFLLYRIITQLTLEIVIYLNVSTFTIKEFSAVTFHSVLLPSQAILRKFMLFPIIQS